VRDGNPEAALLGTCRVNFTGGWDKFNTFTCRLRNPAGNRDVCLIFKGDDTECCRLNWFAFTETGSP